MNRHAGTVSRQFTWRTQESDVAGDRNFVNLFQHSYTQSLGKTDGADGLQVGSKNLRRDVLHAQRDTFMQHMISPCERRKIKHRWGGAFSKPLNEEAKPEFKKMTTMKED